MVKGPLLVIVDLIVFIITSTIDLIKGITNKLIELFTSLALMATTGIAGFIIASIIGGIVLFFALKYVFKTTVSLAKILLVYGFLVIIILFVVFMVIFQ